MNQRRTAPETRELVFEACSRILRREGLANLTLESVADEVGLSKGGLLYHFPNKESLVEALFEYHNQKFDTRLKVLAEEEGDDAGAWLRAYAKASIEQITDPGNAGQIPEFTMGYDVTETQGCVGGEGEINAVHQAALKIPRELTPAFCVVHPEKRQGEDPDLDRVGA